MHLSETFYVFTRATRGLCRHVVSVFVCRRKIHWFPKMLLFSIYYDKWRGYRGKPFRNSGVTRRLAVLNWRSSSIHPSSSFCFSALLVFSWLLCAWLSVGNSAQEIDWKRVVSEMTYMYKQSKAKQRCVMGVGVIIRYLSGFCSRPRLTQPYNHIIYPGIAKIYLVFFWKCLL